MAELSTDILILAYSNGFFPMPHPDTGEMCWFNPDPRAIIPLDNFHVSKSLKRRINSGELSATLDMDFPAVMRGCANREETWINDEIFKAYTDLHLQGMAHSIEVWSEGKLVGGLYGVSIGAAFFAESKFHTKTDASKYALWSLVQLLNASGGQLLEVQFITKHLQSLGAIEIASNLYMNLLAQAIQGRMNLNKGPLPIA